MNYLIVKTSSIGDIIQTFPVADYLRHKDPDCRIDWIVEEEYAPILEAHPQMTTVLTIATRRWRQSWANKRTFQELKQTVALLRRTTYDVVFDLQGNTKSGLITQVACSKHKVGFGWKSAPEWPNCFATNIKFDVAQNSPIQRRYLSIVEQFFRDSVPFQPHQIKLQLTEDDNAQLIGLIKTGSPRIMVAFSSKWENKCLSATAWKQLLQAVREQQQKCYFYFVCGSLEEKTVADSLVAAFGDAISLQGLSFPLWQRLMGEMDLVMTVDSAALALCGTTSTPSLGFFGPTLAHIYNPLGLRRNHFQGQCPYQVKFSARCPRLRSCRTGSCLKQVPIHDLIQAYLGTLESLPSEDIHSTISNRPLS